MENTTLFKQPMTALYFKQRTSIVTNLKNISLSLKT